MNWMPHRGQTPRWETFSRFMWVHPLEDKREKEACELWARGSRVVRLRDQAVRWPRLKCQLCHHVIFKEAEHLTSCLCLHLYQIGLTIVPIPDCENVSSISQYIMAIFTVLFAGLERGWSLPICLPQKSVINLLMSSRWDYKSQQNPVQSKRRNCSR